MAPHIDDMLRRAEALLDADLVDQTGLVGSERFALVRILRDLDSVERWHDLYWSIYDQRSYVVDGIGQLLDIEQPRDSFESAISQWQSILPQKQFSREELILNQTVQRPSTRGWGQELVDDLDKLISDLVEWVENRFDDLDSASSEQLQMLLCGLLSRVRWKETHYVGTPDEDIRSDLHAARSIATRLMMRVWRTKSGILVEALAKVRPGLKVVDPGSKADLMFDIDSGLERSLAFLCVVALVRDGLTRFEMDDHESAFELWARAFALMVTANSEERSGFDDYWEPIDGPWEDVSRISEQHFVDAFERLREQPDGDWGRLYELSQTALLAGWMYEAADPEVEVRDGHGAQFTWWDYWRRAESWLEGRMTPDQLRDRQRFNDDRVAGERLQTYFLTGRSWRALTPRAKAALIAADDALFRTRLGRPGRIVDEIAIAVEETLQTGIWEMAREWASAGDGTATVRDPALLAVATSQRTISRLIAGAESSGGITLNGFRTLISHTDTGVFLSSAFGQNGSTWIKKDLVPAIRRLQELRNPDRHDADRQASIDQARSTFAEWIGAGSPSLLVKLLSLSPPAAEA